MASNYPYLSPHGWEASDYGLASLIRAYSICLRELTLLDRVGFILYCFLVHWRIKNYPICTLIHLISDSEL